MKRIALVLLLLAVSAEAQAKMGSLADAPSVRHQTFIQKGRHELTVTPLGVTVGKAYNNDMVFQAGYQYHFTNWISAGLEIGYGGVSFKTGLTEGIERELRRTEDQNSTGVARSGLGLLALVKGSITPLSGKLVLGGKYLGYVDFHVNFGVGMATIKYMDWAAPPSNIGLAVMVGAGFRYFPTKLLSINVDVNDYMVPRRETKAKSSSFTQNPTVLLGVSFFLPEAGRGL
jgi:outer membrane beta-barrel protein